MTPSTPCMYLWHALFIHYNGDIYSCCRFKPEKLGNIYENNLKDVINNNVIKSHRRDALNGRLKCYPKCVLIDKKNVKPLGHELETINSEKNSLLLKIDFGNRCNIKCIMCSQDKRNKETLDYDILVKNIPLELLSEVSLQGGEPLFIESCKKYYDYLAAHKMKILFMTNGTLLDDVWAEKISLHSQELYISINGATKEVHEKVNRGSKWELVLNNIQRLIKARERNKTSLVIRGHMTVVPENIYDIAPFLTHFRELGFDKIEFGFSSEVEDYYKQNPSIFETLKPKILQAYEKCDKSLIGNLPL